MKKLLIATAALAMVAGTVQAQSSVTIYGILDIGYSDVSNKTSNLLGDSAKTSRTSTGNGDGGYSTSRLGFRGTEDLGGGMKANFRLEYDLQDVGTGANTFGARESWAGLQSNSMGELRLGRQFSSIHSVVTGGSVGTGNNTAGAMYSGSGPDTVNSSGARPHDTAASKAITYISPRFNGLTVEVQYAQLKDERTSTEDEAGNTAAELTGQDTQKQQGASLKYSAGKLNLGYGYQQLKRSDTINTLDDDDLVDPTGSDGEVGKSTVHAFTANYDFGVARLFVMHAQTKNSTTIIATGAFDAQQKRSVTEVGASFPVGKTLLWASMYDGSSKNTEDPAVSDKDDLNGFQLGALYSLSKRTNLYAIYGEQERKGTGLDNNGDNVKSTGLSAGVRHTF
jgi:predicted porin